jgi:nucleotide-binding universal stress UspA family protein
MHTTAALFVSRSSAGHGATPSHNTGGMMNIAPRIRRATYITSRKDDDQTIYLGTTKKNKAGKKENIITGTDDDFQLYDPLEVHTKIILPDSAEGKTPAGEPGELPAVKRRIMVAVGENNAQTAEACDFLLENMTREGDCVHLMHVIAYAHGTGPPELADAYTILFPNEEVLKRMVEKSEGMLTALADKFKAAGIPVEVDVVVERTRQDVAKVLCKEAETLGMAALVVCTTTHHAWEAVLFGSVATYCSRHSNVPLMVLH